MKLQTLLAILQQSEYDFHILQRWEHNHRHEEINLSPEKWTPKLKIINNVCNALPFLPILTRIRIGLWVTKPIEFATRKFIYKQAQQKLKRYKKDGLKVIAIGGSYGKTSTKNILTHALSDTNEVLATPLSINTLLGIAQVIKTDLQKHHKVFLVELGEYHPEDIPALTQFLKPHYGILTPIGRQHLEIIGGMDNIVKSLTSFVQFFDPADILIHEKNRKYFSNFTGSFYGVDEKAKYRVINSHISRAGTEYQIEDNKSQEQHATFIPLFGEHQAVNTLAAVWCAQKLQIDAKQIFKRLRTLPYINRRHEPTFAENNVLILDNSYNTNPDSVEESLKLVNQLEPTKRFIVTLGFTELGRESDQIHYEFGRQLAKYVDYVGLIKAPWSDRISDGFTSNGGSSDHIVIAKTQEEAFQKIQQYVVPGSIILFEGGYREVYI